MFSALLRTTLNRLLILILVEIAQQLPWCIFSDLGILEGDERGFSNIRHCKMVQTCVACLHAHTHTYTRIYSWQDWMGQQTQQSTLLYVGKLIQMAKLVTFYKPVRSLTNQKLGSDQVFITKNMRKDKLLLYKVYFWWICFLKASGPSGKWEIIMLLDA